METGFNRDDSILIGAGNTRTQVKFEPGEEKLAAVRDFRNKDGRVSLGCWIDGGSTQTSGIMVTAEEASTDKIMEEMANVYVIPSNSYTVANHTVPASESAMLYDNMHAITSALNAEAPSNFFKGVTVRGALGDVVDGEENRVGSKLKTHDPVFIANIIDWIGYSAMLKFGNEIPTELDLHLAIALPSDDQTDFNLKVFNKNMKSFIWQCVPFGVTIKMNIKEMMHHTEPEAFVKGYYILSGKKVPEVVLHVDGGGRSTGPEILVKGVSSRGIRTSLEIAGTHLLNDLNTLYVNKFGGRPLPREKLEEAIRTGVVTLGEKTRNDVTDLIILAKDNKAAELYSAIRRSQFDTQSKVRADMVSVVSVSGRFFNYGTYNYSVAKKFEELVLEDMPNADFIHIQESFIPQGLLLLTFTKMKLLAGMSSASEEAAVAEETISYTPSDSPVTEAQETPADEILVETEARLEGE